jgi:hypothetical protein
MLAAVVAQELLVTTGQLPVVEMVEPVLNLVFLALLFITPAVAAVVLTAPRPQPEALAVWVAVARVPPVALQTSQALLAPQTQAAVVAAETPVLQA